MWELLLVIIIIFAIVIGVKFLFSKAMDAMSSTSKTSSSTNTSTATASYIYSNMPSDAHAQIEALSRLIHTVNSAYPFLKNDYAKGSLYIYHNEQNTVTINFWYDWDNSSVQSIIEERYSLSPAFSFQDGGWLKYQTNNVTNFDSWCKSDFTNTFSIDPVIATLENNCSGLKVTLKQVSSNGINCSFTCM